MLHPSLIPSGVRQLLALLDPVPSFTTCSHRTSSSTIVIYVSVLFPTSATLKTETSPDCNASPLQSDGFRTYFIKNFLRIFGTPIAKDSSSCCLAETQLRVVLLFFHMQLLGWQKLLSQACASYHVESSYGCPWHKLVLLQALGRFLVLFI
jgi:hypothetical protein